MKSIHIIGATLLAILGLVANVQAQSSREQLAQMVEQLQKVPGDTTLRERVIKLGAEIKPPPAIPEEARKHFVEGTTIVKAAQNPQQQALAAQSFTEALKIAPWWADAYYNLAAAQELAGKYDEAEKTFAYYLLTNPSETERREAQDRIYALGAKRKLATVTPSEKPPANVEGYWSNGTLDFSVVKNGGAFAIIPGESRIWGNWRASNVDVTDQQVRFGVQVDRSLFVQVDLSLSSSGNELVGTNATGGSSFPLTLKKAAR